MVSEVVNFLRMSVTYVLPIVAIILSVLSYVDSRKTNKFQQRLSLLEERIKTYELEEKEKERVEATIACVEARIVRLAKNQYKMKIWNSGKATAFNVDFEAPDELRGLVTKDKVPYEYLESNKSFDEHVLVHLNFPRKFPVVTRWTDENGKPYSKEQIVTI